MMMKAQHNSLKICCFSILMSLSAYAAECPQSITLKQLDDLKNNPEAGTIIGDHRYVLNDPEKDLAQLPVVRGMLYGAIALDPAKSRNDVCVYSYRGFASLTFYNFSLRKAEIGTITPKNKAEAYHVLGLAPGATCDEARKEYKKLSIKHHPDKGGDAEKFKQISNALSIVCNDNQNNNNNNNQ